MNFSSLPCVLHAPPISSSCTGSIYIYHRLTSPTNFPWLSLPQTENSQLFWEPRYTAVARTRITGNTSHGRYCCVTSPRITENTFHVIPSHCCDVIAHAFIATVHAWTRRKHFQSIVEWSVCHTT
jgi:hypothetical protein